MMLDGECGERCLVKAAQDELLLAGVGVDVADGMDAGHAGLEFFRVHLQRLLLEIETPLRDRPELRMQSEKCEHMISGNLQGGEAVLGLQNRAGQPGRPRGRVAVQRRDMPFDQPHLAGGHQVAHAGHRGRRSAKLRAPMHQGQGARLLAQRDGPIERRIAAAADDQVAAVKFRRRLDAIVHARALEFLDTGQCEPSRLK